MMALLLPILATTVIEGNTRVSTSVRTDVSGGGTVHTRVTTTVNGNTETVESDLPGVISVERRVPVSVTEDSSRPPSEPEQAGTESASASTMVQDTAEVTIGDTKTSLFRYYAYAVYGWVRKHVIRYFEIILDKL